MYDAQAALAGANTLDRRQLFEREALPHLDALYGAALRLTRNEDQAHDLLQETMLRALRFFHMFEPGTNCRAWMLTILHNNFLNHWRRRGRERIARTAEEFELELEAESLRSDQRSSDPEQMLSGRMVGGLIRSALDTLPAEFRAVLMLVDVQELNYGEAARVLGVPTGTIKSRVSRGRAVMRHALGGLARIQGLSVALPARRFVARTRPRPGRGV
jgi:RNA polymerase sigma-70 factor (ECF subfamily)